MTVHRCIASYIENGGLECSTLMGPHLIAGLVLAASPEVEGAQYYLEQLQENDFVITGVLTIIMIPRTESIHL